MKTGYKRGFTLIEILITTVLVFLLFSIIYATFFSVSNTVDKIQEDMRISEIMARFLIKFSREVRCMIREKKTDIFFSYKIISFLTMVEGIPYPVRITYKVQRTPENFEKLLRKQESLLGDYSFVLPVIDCENINFMFYSDGIWYEYAYEPEKITAIALKIKKNGEDFFFPVRIYGEIDEEKEK